MHAGRDPYAECVHCGLCLSACPTYVELGTEMDSPRGRIYLMRGVHEGSLDLSSDVVRHLDLCLACRACETACPSGVRYGALIEAARERIAAHYPRPWRDRLRLWLIGSVLAQPRRLKAVLLPLRWLELAGILPLLRRRSRWLAMLPELGSWQPLPQTAGAHAGAQRRVALLSGCVAQVMFAATNRATLRVLLRNGCSVDTPRAQGCCGALHLHAGDRTAAQRFARRNIDAFPADVEAIVVNAAGCGAMMKEYGQLLAEDPAYAERARQFAAKVRDVTELLAALPIAVPQSPLQAKVTYHDACHLAHAQGIRQAPRALLQSIPGLQLIELPESDHCCGSAGSYNLSQPEMARRLGRRKAENIQATGADIVASANPGCSMQLRSALAELGVQVEVKHPVEILDAAYSAARGEK